MAAVLKVSDPVKFCVVPSLNVPVACSCRAPPIETEMLRGCIAMEVTVAAVTTTLAFPVLPPNCPLIVAPPGASAVVNPVAFTVATLLAEELHVAEPVTFCVLPSEREAVALNCAVVPLTIVHKMGVTVTLCTVVFATVSEADDEKV